MQTRSCRRFAVCRLLVCTVASVTFLLATGAAFAQGGPYWVSNGHDHGPGSLREAIDIADVGEMILFAEHVSAVVLTTGELTISKDVIIKGPGAKRLTIRRSLAPGTPQFRVFHVSNATLRISGVTIANGSTLEAGAGIRVNNSGALVITKCAISRNKGGSGPAINTSAGTTTTVQACTLSDNESLDGYDAGAVYNVGTMTIARSTLARNKSSGSAGAILNAGLLTIANSTIAGNSAAVSPGGVRAFLGSPDTPRVAKVRNSIIAKNSDPSGQSDFSGRLRSLGYNLIGKTTDETEIVGETTGNRLNIDPLLGPLQDNGGPTLTRGLLSGSPALDRGDAGASRKDQRGHKRPVDFQNVANATKGDGSDIGAYELQAGGATLSSEDASDLDDAVE